MNVEGVCTRLPINWILILNISVLYTKYEDQRGEE